MSDADVDNGAASAASFEAAMARILSKLPSGAQQSVKEYLQDFDNQAKCHIVFEAALSFWDEFQYQGFKQETTLAIFFKKGEEAGLEFPKILEDLWIAAMIGQARGTSVKKLEAHSTDLVKGRINRLKGVYGLVNVKGVANTKAITIGRLMNSVPYVPCSLVYFKGNHSVPFNLLPGVPHAIFCTCFAGLIPNGPAYASLRAVLKQLHLQFLRLFDAVINKKPQSEADMIRYQDAAINSTYYSDLNKISWLVNLDVIKSETDMTIKPPDDNAPRKPEDHSSSGSRTATSGPSSSPSDGPSASGGNIPGVKKTAMSGRDFKTKGLLPMTVGASGQFIRDGGDQQQIEMEGEDEQDDGDDEEEDDDFRSTDCKSPEYVDPHGLGTDTN